MDWLRWQLSRRGFLPLDLGQLLFLCLFEHALSTDQALLIVFVLLLVLGLGRWLCLGQGLHRFTLAHLLSNPECVEIAHCLPVMKHVTAQKVQSIRLLVLRHLATEEVLSTFQVLVLLHQVGSVARHSWIGTVLLGEKAILIAHLAPELTQELIVLRQVLANEFIPLLELPLQPDDLDAIEFVLVLEVGALDLRLEALDVEVH